MQLRDTVEDIVMGVLIMAPIMVLVVLLAVPRNRDDTYEHPVSAHMHEIPCAEDERVTPVWDEHSYPQGGRWIVICAPEDDY